MEEAKTLVDNLPESKEKTAIAQSLTQTTNPASVGFLTFLNKLFGRTKGEDYYTVGEIPKNLKPTIAQPAYPIQYQPEQPISTNLGSIQLELYNSAGKRKIKPANGTKGEDYYTVGEIPTNLKPTIAQPAYPIQYQPEQPLSTNLGNIQLELYNSAKKGEITSTKSILQRVKDFFSKKISEKQEKLNEIKDKLKAIKGQKGYNFLLNVLGEKFLSKATYKSLNEISVRSPIVSTLIDPKDWRDLSTDEKKLIQEYTKLYKGYSLELYSPPSGASIFYAKEHLQKLADIISKQDNDPIPVENLLELYTTNTNNTNKSNITNVKNIMLGYIYKTY